MLIVELKRGPAKNNTDGKMKNNINNLTYKIIDENTS